MATQQFYVGGRYLGQRTIPDNYVVPGFDVRHHFSYAFFCMRCGEVWGRLVHLPAKLTQCVCRPCQKHGDGRLSTTHFFQGECTNLEADWPADAIRHELLCELDLAQDDFVASPGFEEILAKWKETA